MSALEIVRAGLSIGADLGILVLAIIGAHVVIFGRGGKQ